MKNLTISSLLLSNVHGSDPIFLSKLDSFSIRSSSFSKLCSTCIFFIRFRNFAAIKSNFRNISGSIFRTNTEFINNKSFDEPIFSKKSNFSILHCTFSNINSSNPVIDYLNRNTGNISVHFVSFSNITSTYLIKSRSKDFSIVSCCFKDCIFENSLCDSQSSSSAVMTSSYMSKIEAPVIFYYYSYSTQLKDSNISSVASTRRFSCFGAIEQTSLFYEVRFSSFENIKSGNVFNFELSNEMIVSMSNFIYLNESRGIFSASLVNKSEIYSCIFRGPIQNLLAEESNEIKFYGCIFDNDILIDTFGIFYNCTITDKYDIYSINLLTENCWMTFQSFHSRRPSSFFFKLCFILFFFGIIGFILYILVNRYNKARDGREALERLNIFEGEDNPEIKLMLMDIKNESRRSQFDAENDRIYIDISDD